VHQYFWQKRYAMRIWLNSDKMNAYGVAFNDVSNSLISENVDCHPVKFMVIIQSLTIKVLSRLTTEQQFRNLIIKEDSSGIVRLGDVSRNRIRPGNIGTSWKYNGVNAVV